MKISTIRLSMSVIGQINQLKEKYELRNQAETVELVFNFIAKYHVDVKRDFVNSTLDNLFVSSRNIEVKLDELNANLCSVINNMNKGNKTIVSLLRAYEKNYLVPLLLQARSSPSCRRDDDFRKNEDYMKSLKVASEKKENEIQSKHLLIGSLDYELKQSKHELEQKKKELDLCQEQLRRLKSQFKQSLITGKYSLSLSEKEYKDL